MENTSKLHFDTKAVHAGEPNLAQNDPVTEAVYMSSTYKMREGGGYDDSRYMRLSNTPNHLNLHAKLAALESAEDALVTSSGMSAIATTVLALVSSGDHILSQESLYGGTFGFFTKDLQKFGISYDFFDPRDESSWELNLKPNTKVIYTESLSSPLQYGFDYQMLSDFAKKRGLILITDNTTATPVNFRPAEYGFDLSLHSATKFLNGHSDVTAGVVAGKKELVKKIHLFLNHLGGSLDTHACFLLNRGLKTLPLRVAKHGENATKIVAFLSEHPKVEKVYHPSVESHPTSSYVSKYFDAPPPVVSFLIKDSYSAKKFVEHTALSCEAPSFGGVESLICRPINSSHSKFSKEELIRVDVRENLIRLSPGIEDHRDLISDISNALDNS